MTENRTAPRIKTSMALAFSSNGDFLCGHIMNISCSGLFLNTETVLPVGTELALRIRLPEDLESMAIAGRVVWAKQAACASPSGMGIEFVRTSPEDRRKINSFIKGSLKDIQTGHARKTADEAERYSNAELKRIDEKF